MELRQPRRRVEPVDGLHQVEGSADQRFIGTGCDQARVGNVGPLERAQHPCLSTHGLVAIRPFVDRRSPQHIMLPTPFEVEKDVLRAAGQSIDDTDLTGGIDYLPKG